ncbi:hypothetical protein B0H10DRAFT_1942311 [Mycena sp. CBHHK59/15]|nr:hypothetical protein B0H10DRAFT_1942311 [Mycena sp. CBHHK59/15]
MANSNTAAAVNTNTEDICVDFTPRQCQRCNALVPEGAELQFLHANNSEQRQAGRYVCGNCNSYYKAKSTTTIRRRSVPPSASLSDRKVVHCAISGAQRGELTFPLQHIGGIPQVQPIGGLPYSSHVGFPLAARNGTPQYTPFHFALPPPRAAQAPAQLAQLQQVSGYTDNHQYYVSDKASYVVTVEVHATRLPVGKIKAILIGDVLEVVDDVDVHMAKQVHLSFEIRKLMNLHVSNQAYRRYEQAEEAAEEASRPVDGDVDEDFVYPRRAKEKDVQSRTQENALHPQLIANIWKRRWTRVDGSEEDGGSVSGSARALTSSNPPATFWSHWSLPKSVLMNWSASWAPKHATKNALAPLLKTCGLQVLIYRIQNLSIHKLVGTTADWRSCVDQLRTPLLFWTSIQTIRSWVHSRWRTWELLKLLFGRHCQLGDCGQADFLGQGKNDSWNIPAH